MNTSQTKAYARQLGDKLRQARQELGLSLMRVEEKSEGRWKAVVVGSYERADRAITVPRLMELADFYGVPVAQLLPAQSEPSGVDVARLLRRALAIIEGGAE